jgi:hypothetical protein
MWKTSIWNITTFVIQLLRNTEMTQWALKWCVACRYAHCVFSTGSDAGEMCGRTGRLRNTYYSCGHCAVLLKTLAATAGARTQRSHCAVSWRVNVFLLPVREPHLFQVSPRVAELCPESRTSNTVDYETQRNETQHTAAFQIYKIPGKNSTNPPTNIQGYENWSPSP